MRTISERAAFPLSDSRLLSDRPLEPELGAVVAQDRVEVVEPGLGQRLDRLQDLDGTGGARQLGSLSDVEEVELERLEGLDEGLPGLVDLAGCRLASLVGADHLGRDTGLGPDLLQVRGLMLGRPAAHDGAVGEAEVPQVPEEAGHGVAPGAEVAEERIRAAAEAAP